MMSSSRELSREAKDDGLEVLDPDLAKYLAGKNVILTTEQTILANQFRRGNFEGKGKSFLLACLYAVDEDAPRFSTALEGR